MIKLITDINEISSLLNINVMKMFTSVSVSFDSYKVAAPKIIKFNNKKYLFACHLEKGNLDAQKEILNSFPPDIEIIYYSPYFTFEIPSEHIYPDFISAFKKIFKTSEQILVQKNIPVSIYKLLLNEYIVKFDDEEKYNPIYNMYVISKNEIIDKMNIDRDKANKIAIELVNKSPLKSYLEELIFKRTESRFDSLDEQMEKNKIDAVLCTSPLGLQEITGYGLKKYQENYQLSALYKKGENNVYLFSKQPLEEFGKGKEVNIFVEILKKMSNCSFLGIEEDHISTSFFKELEIHIDKVQGCISCIRKSRQNRGWEDLSYYIIASRATVYAIEEALEWAKNKINKQEQISELDIEKYYELKLQEFKNNHNIPFYIEPMLTICSSGSRTVIPSLPTEYYLDKNTKSLKLDAGVSIFDHQGIHHAASDITRTLILEKKMMQAYKKLEEYMIKEVIPNIKSGMQGKEIYQLAVSKIENDKNFFKNIGLLSSNVEIFADIYERNVGHLMGLQEPVTLFFLKYAEEKVSSGMVAAIEYQWHTKIFGIGIEDNFIITKNRGLNFSRDKF